MSPLCGEWKSEWIHRIKSRIKFKIKNRSVQISSGIAFCGRKKKFRKKKANIFYKMMHKSGFQYYLSIGLVLIATNGLCHARSGLYSEESPPSIRTERCHQGCIKKVKMKFFHKNSNVTNWNFSFETQKAPKRSPDTFFDCRFFCCSKCEQMKFWKKIFRHNKCGYNLVHCYRL